MSNPTARQGGGMTDRELLELAAKAAGHMNATYQDMAGWGESRYGLSEALYLPDAEDYWNPLVRDGDALRLAAELELCIEFGDCLDSAPIVSVGVIHDRDNWVSRMRFPDGMRQTRRAIVEAAAKYQKALEGDA